MDCMDGLILKGHLQTDAMCLFKSKGCCHTKVKGKEWRAWTQVITEKEPDLEPGVFGVPRYLAFLIVKESRFYVEPLIHRYCYRADRGNQENLCQIHTDGHGSYHWLGLVTKSDDEFYPNCPKRSYMM